jgi:hypothetical protein
LIDRAAYLQGQSGGEQPTALSQHRPQAHAALLGWRFYMNEHEHDEANQQERERHKKQKVPLDRCCEHLCIQDSQQGCCLGTVAGVGWPCTKGVGVHPPQTRVVVVPPGTKGVGGLLASPMALVHSMPHLHHCCWTPTGPMRVGVGGALGVAEGVVRGEEAGVGVGRAGVAATAVVVREQRTADTLPCLGPFGQCSSHP